MSEAEISQELTLATELFDLSLADIEKITVNAVKDSFASYHDRVDLIYRSILSTVAILFAELNALVFSGEFTQPHSS